LQAAAACALVASFVTACGDDNYNDNVSCGGSCVQPTAYVGSVSGLATGQSATLQDDFGNVTIVAANGSFTFAPLGFVAGAPAQLGVLVQPSGQDCTVVNGSPNGAGHVPVTITCATVSTPPTSSIALYAGMEAVGAADGTGAAATFNNPMALAADASGNVYVADTFNNTIRKIAAGGVVTTISGSAGTFGSTNGTGSAALFARPSGIAVDASGNLYVSDTANNTIREISTGGVVTTIAGSPIAEGSSNGTGGAALFDAPEGIAVDGSGNLFVADTGNLLIRKIAPGGIVTTFAGMAGISGTSDGTGAGALFQFPQSLAIDGSGNLYVGDGPTTIRKISAAGVVTTLAVPASSFGQLSGLGAASLGYPQLALTADPAGDVYVTGSNSTIVLKIAQSGAVTTIVGANGQYAFNAGPLPGTLSFAQALSVQGTSLYISVNSGVALVQNVP